MLNFLIIHALESFMMLSGLRNLEGEMYSMVLTMASMYYFNHSWVLSVLPFELCITLSMHSFILTFKKDFIEWRVNVYIQFDLVKSSELDRIPSLWKYHFSISAQILLTSSLQSSELAPNPIMLMWNYFGERNAFNIGNRKIMRNAFVLFNLAENNASELEMNHHMFSYYSNWWTSN